MSIVFAKANTQYIVQTPPVVPLPVTMGLWFMPTSDPTGTVQAIGDRLATGAGNDFSFGFDGTSFFIYCGATEIATAAGVVAANVWHYVVIRYQAANARAAILPITGVPVHLSNTDNVALTPDKLSLGAGGAGGSPSDVAIAEYFLTDTDIQPDGTQLSTSTLYRLAYYGPFSIPHIGSRVVQYESFRTPMGGTQGYSFYARYPKQPWTWTATSGSPIVGPHPPIPGYYRPPSKYSPNILSPY